MKWYHWYPFRSPSAVNQVLQRLLADLYRLLRTSRFRLNVCGTANPVPRFHRNRGVARRGQSFFRASSDNHPINYSLASLPANRASGVHRCQMLEHRRGRSIAGCNHSLKVNTWRDGSNRISAPLEEIPTQDAAGII